MVHFWINEQVLDTARRIHNEVITYRVFDAYGAYCDYQGRVSSLVVLRRLLCNRLRLDYRITIVQVILSSGVYLCECSRS